MNTPLDFPDIIERYRAAGSDSNQARAMQDAFDANTHAWAEFMIALHILEYDMDPALTAQLWDIVKQANLSLLTHIEPEIFSVSNFMEFYLEYIHNSLVAAYFQDTPRLAEIIRKNVKWKCYSENVLPEIEAGALRSTGGRRVQKRSANVPLFDAWTHVKQNNYPETIEYIIEQQSAQQDDDKPDIRIRRSQWEEVEAALKESIENHWPYDRSPYTNPGEVTRDFFRTTLNWFLVTIIFKNEKLAPKAKRIIDDLIAKEKYNVSTGVLDRTCVAQLMESFSAHGPSDFFTDKNVGVKGRNLGMLFDKIANDLYNKLLLPELAQFTSSDWGIER